MVRELIESNSEEEASRVAMEIQERISEFVNGDPVSRRMLLFMRCDKCPIGKIQNTYRAQVLMKILNNAKNGPLMAFCQQLTANEWKARVLFETDPASLA